MKKTAILILLIVFSTGCQQNINKEVTTTTSTTVSNTKITATPTSKNDTLSGYLHIDQSSVLFINWLEQDSNLNGTMQRTYTSKGIISSDSFPFTGVSSKESISLNFTGGIFNGMNGKTIMGTTSDDDLTLYFPNKDNGTLAPVTFKFSNVQEYNDATAIFEEQIEQSNIQDHQDKLIQDQVQATVEQQEKEQKAVKLANQLLTEEIEAMKSIIELNKEIANSFVDVFASYDIHWLEMKNHKIELIDSAKVKPFDSNQLYVVENNLYVLENDEYAIQNDAYAIENIEYQFSNYLEDLNNKSKAIQKRWNELQTAVSHNSTDSKPNYTEEDIAGYLTVIKTEVNRATSILQSNKKSASTYDQNAKDMLKNMTDYVSGLQASDE